MERAERRDSDREAVEQDRGAAAAAAPRPTPLNLVSAAIAGDDLGSVASSAAGALGCSVAIAIPALGDPVSRPDASIPADSLRAIVDYAAAVMRGEARAAPAVVADAVPVTIGRQLVGMVAAVNSTPGGLSADERAWLEAVAAAAAVAARLRDAQKGGIEESRRAILAALRGGPPTDLTAIVADARRLGADLSQGAIAICALGEPGAAGLEGVSTAPGTLLAELGPGRIYGLIAGSPLAGPGDDPAWIAEVLALRGLHVAISAPRRSPQTLHLALREVELLAELAATPEAGVAGQEETYRLLIGVLLRDPEELERLRAQTISPLASYDRGHDTELLATLRAFLAHDGSTTETAEALELHRHTVGYRLARVHEVSGLSPYESDGRERLSLGLKAHHILSVAPRTSAC
jgi:hypothetical protein